MCMPLAGIVATSFCSVKCIATPSMACSPPRRPWHNNDSTTRLLRSCCSQRGQRLARTVVIYPTHSSEVAPGDTTLSGVGTPHRLASSAVPSPLGAWRRSPRGVLVGGLLALADERALLALVGSSLPPRARRRVASLPRARRRRRPPRRIPGNLSSASSAAASAAAACSRGGLPGACPAASTFSRAWLRLLPLVVVERERG
jgi:hypothetical protein